MGGYEGVIPMINADCKIPDGWIIVIISTATEKSPTIYKIFSYWQFTDICNASSGVEHFSDCNGQ